MADQRHPHFPIEIITSILLLLPPKVLMKFTCVSRSWKNLIRDPSFVKVYLKNSLANGNGYLLYLTTNYNPWSFKLIDNVSFQNCLELRMPFLTDGMKYAIVGSFNGMLCLGGKYENGFMICLCNPSIRKLKLLPLPTTDRELINDMAVGFAYHKESNDYKIIRIIFSKADDMAADEDDTTDDEEGSEYEYIEVELYSLNSNSWKQILVDVFLWDFLVTCSGDLVNQSIHWLAYRKEKGKLVILSFDLQEEIFKEIALPNYDRKDQEVVELIGVFNEALSIFLFSPNWSLDGGSEHCELWVMKDYGVIESWTKMYNISVDGGVSNSFTFTKRGEIILRDEDGNVLVYNFDTCSIQYLDIEEEASLDLTFVNYQNSLVLIDEETDGYVDQGEAAARIIEEDPVL